MKLSDLPAPLKPGALKKLVPALGGLGLALRVLLFATGLDDKGLIAANHPAWILMWLLTAAAAVLIGLCVRPIHGPAAYRGSFPGSPVAALGCGLAAVSAVLTALAQFRAGNLLYALTGLLAAAALVPIALCRLTGKKPNFLLHCLVCIHFALALLSLYQTWSFDPQLHDYCFQLFACIALTMTAYHLAAFDLGRGSHRRLWAWGLVAVYLCCLCLGTSEHLFYLAGGVWAFTNLSNLRRPRHRKKPEPTVPV